MKKALCYTMVLMFLFAGHAFALQFSSTGSVNYNYNDSWDPDSLTGIAQFFFTIETPGVEVDHVTLEFENDIFNLAELNSTDFTVLAPLDWQTSLIFVDNQPGTDDAKASISFGDTMATSLNDPIIIEVAYTLLNAEMYNNAIGDGWEWDEGQAWGLSYSLGNSNISGLEEILTSYHVSTGSTAPVPEPATMLLFGAGLLGIGFLKRKRSSKNYNAL